MAPLVRELSEEGIQVNVTALMTLGQVDVIANALRDGARSCVSAKLRPSFCCSSVSIAAGLP